MTVQKTGQIRQETLYGITSLPAEQASPTRLLEMLRSYWGIENGLHYRRDVTLHEDETRFTKHAAARIMSIINNMILALIAKTVHPFVPLPDVISPPIWTMLLPYSLNFENSL